MQAIEDYLSVTSISSTTGNDEGGRRRQRAPRDYGVELEMQKGSQTRETAKPTWRGEEGEGWARVDR